MPDGLWVQVGSADELKQQGVLQVRIRRFRIAL